MEYFDGEYTVIDWDYFFSGEYELPDECTEKIVDSAKDFR